MNYLLTLTLSVSILMINFNKVSSKPATGPTTRNPSTAKKPSPKPKSVKTTPSPGLSAEIGKAADNYSAMCRGYLAMLKNDDQMKDLVADGMALCKQFAQVAKDIPIVM